MAPPLEATIEVPSEDPKKKETQQKETEDDKSKSAKADGKQEPEKDEMSEEDLQLKNELEMLVERLKESNKDLYRPTLETLRTLIRTATSSMTSVPKPLKFLRPHYRDLQAIYDSWTRSEDKSLFADILSVLAMTYSDTQPRGTLNYRLLSASLAPSPSTLLEPGSWGHEYVRHLAAELGDEWVLRTEGEPPVAEPPIAAKPDETPSDAKDGASAAAGSSTKADGKAPEVPVVPVKIEATDDQLKDLAMQCAKFLLGHNAEPDAVDLLEAMEIIDRLVELVDENTYSRVCLYMIRCVNLLPPPDDIAFLQAAHKIYLQQSKFPEALALAIRLGDPDLIRTDFHAPANPLMKRQLAFLLARAQIPIEWLTNTTEGGDEDIAITEDLPVDLLECLSNSKLSQHFKDFGKEMGVQDPKSLEDVYKSHLENSSVGSSNVDSARGNLAGTFVNAFVNAGFGNDKLMVKAEEGSSWIYKNKDHGKLSAAASLGLSLLWDTEEGLSHVDKYMYSQEEHVKAGALLATGILNIGVRTEVDAALALLMEYVTNTALPLRTASITGLGMAYSGSHRDDLLQLLLPIVADDSLSMEIVAQATLALGFVFVGSGNGEITETVLDVLMAKSKDTLDDKWAKFMILGLAFLYLGLQDQSDVPLGVLRTIEHPISKQAQILVEICAFAGTGNVLRIQQLLHHCDEHVGLKETTDDDEKKDATEDKKDGDDDKEKPDDTFQAFAVIGLALVSMGEDIGSEMVLRMLNHLMHYGEPVVRKSVPLALGLVSASNPQLPILDTLSKYSHDNDLAVALNAIFAMGLVGAGSNNARLAQMLRQLANYYSKEPDCLFMVRVSQGLVHMGKGTIGINPFFSDRTIMNRSAVAGLLATLTAFVDAKSFVLDKYHWMIFFLAPAMYPRFLIMLDEELNSIPVTVRVGQAVDVVGQAGKPRTISGFQTHSTPVRLGTTERAELATEEFIPYAHVLEGFVVLTKNPGYEKEEMQA